MCYDAESPEFFVRDTVTARKAHTCDECRREIPAGARYERATGKWSFSVVTYKTCVACVALRARVAAFERAAGCDSGEDTPPFGSLIEVARECGLMPEE